MALTLLNFNYFYTMAYNTEYFDRDGVQDLIGYSGSGVWRRPKTGSSSSLVGYDAGENRYMASLLNPFDVIAKDVPDNEVVPSLSKQVVYRTNLDGISDALLSIHWQSKLESIAHLYFWVDNPLGPGKVLGYHSSLKPSSQIADDFAYSRYISGGIKVCSTTYDGGDSQLKGTITSVLSEQLPDYRALKPDKLTNIGNYRSVANVSIVKQGVVALGWPTRAAGFAPRHNSDITNYEDSLDSTLYWDNEMKSTPEWVRYQDATVGPADVVITDITDFMPGNLMGRFRVTFDANVHIGAGPQSAFDTINTYVLVKSIMHDGSVQTNRVKIHSFIPTPATYLGQPISTPVLVRGTAEFQMPNYVYTIQIVMTKTIEAPLAVHRITQVLFAPSLYTMTQYAPVTLMSLEDVSPDMTVTIDMRVNYAVVPNEDLGEHVKGTAAREDHPFDLFMVSNMLAALDREGARPNYTMPEYNDFISTNWKAVSDRKYLAGRASFLSGLWKGLKTIWPVAKKIVHQFTGDSDTDSFKSRPMSSFAPSISDDYSSGLIGRASTKNPKIKTPKMKEKIVLVDDTDSEEEKETKELPTMPKPKISEKKDFHKRSDTQSGVVYYQEREEATRRSFLEIITSNSEKREILEENASFFLKMVNNTRRNTDHRTLDNHVALIRKNFSSGDIELMLKQYPLQFLAGAYAIHRGITINCLVYRNTELDDFVKGGKGRASTKAEEEMESKLEQETDEEEEEEEKVERGVYQFRSTKEAPIAGEKKTMNMKAGIDSFVANSPANVLLSEQHFRSGSYLKNRLVHFPVIVKFQGNDTASSVKLIRSTLPFSYWAGRKFSYQEYEVGDGTLIYIDTRLDEVPARMLAQVMEHDVTPGECYLTLITNLDLIVDTSCTLAFQALARGWPSKAAYSGHVDNNSDDIKQVDNVKLKIDYYRRKQIPVFIATGERLPFDSLSKSPLPLIRPVSSLYHVHVGVSTESKLSTRASEAVSSTDRINEFIKYLKDPNNFRDKSAEVMQEELNQIQADYRRMKALKDQDRPVPAKELNRWKNRLTNFQLKSSRALNLWKKKMPTKYAKEVPLRTQAVAKQQQVAQLGDLVSPQITFSIPTTGGLTAEYTVQQALEMFKNYGSSKSKIKILGGPHNGEFVPYVASENAAALKKGIELAGGNGIFKNKLNLLKAVTTQIRSVMQREARYLQMEEQRKQREAAAKERRLREKKKKKKPPKQRVTTSFPTFNFDEV